LQEKSNAFKRFKTLIEKESRREIKFLITGKEGEYTSSVLNEFCIIKGI